MHEIGAHLTARTLVHLPEWRAKGAIRVWVSNRFKKLKQQLFTHNPETSSTSRTTMKPTEPTHARCHDGCGQDIKSVNDDPHRRTNRLKP
jgi:hypothetical protein